MLSQLSALSLLQKMELDKEENLVQIQLAGTLTLKDVQSRGTEKPRASQSLSIREAAAAAVGLRVLEYLDLYPRAPDAKPRLPRFDQPQWVRSYAEHINDPAAKSLVLSFLDLVDACANLPKSGPRDSVVYGRVAELGATLGLVPPAEAARAGAEASITRAEMLRRYESNWPTLGSDLSNSSRNGYEGLSAAKDGRNKWFATVAVAWAKSKSGKWKETSITTASAWGRQDS